LDLKTVFKTLQDRFFNGAAPIGASEDSWASRREEMVEKQIRRRGVTDAAVLAAMRFVPRHEFVAQEFCSKAYGDLPLPIGGEQTISQPYIVAAMTAALRLSGSERVLEVGTGCGYQAAVLSQLVREVHTIEYRAELAGASKERLWRLGFANVRVHHGDGTLGLPECAPFDAILVAAAVPAVPPPLLGQLAVGGRLILPVGGLEHQELHLIQRCGKEFITAKLEACRFVPLIGYYGVQEASPR
jgi:protein-L-isoaspartate(D-aspartate) O-methyltransferase